jgi:hypothetical protein
MPVVQQWSWMTSTIQLVLNRAIQVAKLRIQEENQKENPKTNNICHFKQVVQVSQIPTPGAPQLANLAVSGQMAQLIGSKMMFGNHRIGNLRQISCVPHQLRHRWKRANVRQLQERTQFTPPTKVSVQTGNHLQREVVVAVHPTQMLLGTQAPQTLLYHQKVAN